MARIDSFSFGSIVVDGKKYRRDLIFGPDGTVTVRKGGFWMFGDHTFKKEEIEALAREGAQQVIVGIGTDSKANVSDEVRGDARQMNVEISVLPSHQAVERWNQGAGEGKKVAAIIHITC